MRIVLTVFKVILGLAIAIPVGILVLALTAGVLGTLIGLAMMVLRLAFIGLVGYGLFRLARSLFGSKPKTPPLRELPPIDPYYDAAIRELDTELGHRH